MLQAWHSGDEQAASRLMEIVMGELKKLARKALSKEFVHKPLEPAELVNEAYMRLVKNPPKEWTSRGLFFGYAGRCMRQVLVDMARERYAAKRGGPAQDFSLNTAALGDHKACEVLTLHEAIKALSVEDPRKARVVEMRFFSGLEVKEIAKTLGVSEITIKRDWKHAKMFLFNQLEKG